MFSKDELEIIADMFQGSLYSAAWDTKEKDLYDKVIRLIESAEQPKPPYKPNLPGFSRV